MISISMGVNVRRRKLSKKHAKDILDRAKRLDAEWKEAELEGNKVKSFRVSRDNRNKPFFARKRDRTIPAFVER